MHKKEIQLLLSNLNDANPFKQELNQLLLIPKSRSINKSIERGSTPISDVRSSKKVNPNDLKKKIENEFKQAHMNRTIENFKNKNIIENELRENENGEMLDELKTININNKRKTAGLGFNGQSYRPLESGSKKDTNIKNEFKENKIDELHEDNPNNICNLKTEASNNKVFKSYPTCQSDANLNGENNSENGTENEN